MEMKEKFKKEIWQKDLKKVNGVTSGSFETALKDTNSGRDFLEKWENRGKSLKAEGM